MSRGIFGLCVLQIVALAVPASAQQPAPPAVKEAAATPPGFVLMNVVGIVPTSEGQAVVLTDGDQKTLLPIWIGPSEAMAIQLRLERKRFERPLTHDLLDTLVRELGGELVKVHVDDLKGNTFVATLFLRRGGKVIEIDARPSDSIALAVGNKIPVYVSRRVLDRAGQKADQPRVEERTPEVPAPAEESRPKNVTTM